MFIPTLLIGFKFALANLSIYLTINLLAKRKIGTGDIKLSFVCGLLFSSYFQLFNALTITWIIGGFYAILFRPSAVAFAPFMICGTYLARIF
jgi:Flp pilus assembly protein protease CpaA